MKRKDVVSLSVVAFIFVIVCTLLAFSSCKRKASPPPPPPPKEVVKLSEEEFVQSLVKYTDVVNLKPGDSVAMKISTDLGFTPSAEFAIVKSFKSNWSYSELLPVSKQIPLTIVWVGSEGSHLLVKSYKDLLKFYKPGDNFLVLDPKPKYSIRVGNKKYWLTSEGVFWKTW